MSGALDLLGSALVLLGAAFTLVAAVGLHRMPDTMRRFHVATKPASFAMACTFSGVALQVPLASDVAKLAVALALQLMTAPVAAHLLGRLEVSNREARAAARDRAVGDQAARGPDGGDQGAGSDATTSTT
jgi:multicomponent Na+:H+ antiporter subunit G